MVGWYFNCYCQYADDRSLTKLIITWTARTRQ